MALQTQTGFYALSGLLSSTLRESKVLGARRKRLFLPLIGEKDISAVSISHWIPSVIKLAYTDLSDQDLSFFLADWPALSTSWAFSNNVPLENIFSAAVWKSQSTFSVFYLRTYHRKNFSIWANWWFLRES